MTLPTGTVTFLFTDIEGSTRLLDRLGERYADVLTLHRRLLREAFGTHNGHEVDTQGDAFFVAFPSASDAVAAASLAQKSLAAVDWPEGTDLRVRMGIHTGKPALIGEGYVGIDVHKGARICSAGHGGQVLVSGEARNAVGDLSADVVFRDLGEHLLKDLRNPEHLYQLEVAGIPQEFPRLKTISPSNLPAELGDLIGRTQELEQLEQLLDRPEVRHVTLTGTGGTGKSRLALAAARSALERGAFSSGVFFVPLASISEPGLIPSAFAAALELSGSAAQSFEDAIKAHLAGKRMLLLVDNFEHLLDGASILPELLAAAQGLKIIATSRAPLHTTGEHEYHVTPLSLPKPTDDLDAVARSDAVRLFVARSEAADPTFVLNAQNAAAVRDICARLDGLPLAVELAAAHINVLTPEKLRARLEQRLPMLVGGARDAPERQRTLRATIEWSYELLSEREKQLFARFGVFRGGCTLEAVEEVCLADLESLVSLIDKCLIRAETREGPEPRYMMLETLREYALERLEQFAETEATQERHAQHFLAVAEGVDAQMKGPDQQGCLERLEAEHDNFRSALGWCFDGKDTELGLRLAASLWLFWYTRGHVNEARGWLAAALEHSVAPTAARAKALDGAGYLAGEQGEDERARLLLEESLACAREAGASETIALAATHLSNYIPLDDAAQAVALGEEAVALSRGIGDNWTLAVALNNLGSVAANHREFSRAERLFEESYQLRRELGDVSRLALSLINLGEMAFVGGDPARAKSLLSEALELAIGIGDKRHTCFALADLGCISLNEERHEESRNLLRQSLTLAGELGHRPVSVEMLQGLACVAAGMDLSVRAVRLAAAAEALIVRGSPETPLSQGIYRRYLDALRAQTDPSTWQREWEYGSAIGLDGAVEYALTDD